MGKRLERDMIWTVKITFGARMRQIHSPRLPKVYSYIVFHLLILIRKDIDAELSRYKQDATRLTQQTGVSSVEEVGNMYDVPTYPFSSSSILLLQTMSHLIANQRSNFQHSTFKIRNNRNPRTDSPKTNIG